MGEHDAGKCFLFSETAIEFGFGVYENELGLRSVVADTYAGGWQGFRLRVEGWRLEVGDGAFAEGGFEHGGGDGSGAVEGEGGGVEDGGLYADVGGAAV